MWRNTNNLISENPIRQNQSTESAAVHTIIGGLVHCLGVGLTRRGQPKTFPPQKSMQPKGVIA